MIVLRLNMLTLHDVIDSTCLMYHKHSGIVKMNLISVSLNWLR